MTSTVDTLTFLDLLAETVEEAITDGDVEELAGLHVAVRSDLARLRTIADDLEARLAEVMPKVLELPGLPVLERRAGKDRRAWQSDELLTRVVRLSLDPEGTGEFPTDPMVAVDLVVTGVKACAPITPSMQWRVGALRALDLDPDEWCETKPGRTSVQIHASSEVTR